MKNSKFEISIDSQGQLQSLRLLNDLEKMNWVINQETIKTAQFFSYDKLFGSFDFKVEDRLYSSHSVKPKIKSDDQFCRITYNFGPYQVTLHFDLSEEDCLYWKIEFENQRNIPVKLQEFGIWFSVSYIMFRDKNVKRNMFHSTAVFPSISQDYTKIAVMRRTQKEKSLGFYQLKGSTNSLGSYCDFSNQFLENVSPSLDGMIFHKLLLSGGDKNPKDWIYDSTQLIVDAQNTAEWEFVFREIADQEDFYHQGMVIGHPKVSHPGLVYTGEKFKIQVENQTLTSLKITWMGTNGLLQSQIIESINVNKIELRCQDAGEHKIELLFSNGRSDQIIINVMADVKRLITDRVDYLCENSFQDQPGSEQYAFQPVSKQGESLGKLALILKKNLLDAIDPAQVLKVEQSINYYVLNKWFEGGDFTKPVKLYGSFYRVMDYEYLGHVLFLLSQFSADSLQLKTPDEYLLWAAKIVELRINPELHNNLRGKEESEMLGVFFLYINDLLLTLKERKADYYQRLSRLWNNNILKILEEKNQLKAAMTEHYFDNAGFGSAAASLANSGYESGTKLYGDLILANIGFSNDFRQQNPDRWWESLSYMIHSLWGGVTAAAALDVFHLLKEPSYLEASYRAFAAVLYCYDSQATATNTIKQGAAASTYAVASPHYNRQDLSHNRFGQETFAKDGAMFATMFTEAEQQTSDWDMGEELVAYLDRFGQYAYCYFDDRGQLHGVNCSIEGNEQKWVIHNQAPYPKRIYVLKNQQLKALPGDGASAELCLNLN